MPEKFEKKQPDDEVQRLQIAWEEAIDRLDGIGEDEGYELTLFTQNEKDPEKVKAFLEANQTRLTPEGKYFLQVTYYLRKAKEKNR